MPGSPKRARSCTCTGTNACAVSGRRSPQQRRARRPRPPLRDGLGISEDSGEFHFCFSDSKASLQVEALLCSSLKRSIDHCIQTNSAPSLSAPAGDRRRWSDAVDDSTRHGFGQHGCQHPRRVLSARVSQGTFRPGLRFKARTERVFVPSMTFSRVGLTVVLAWSRLVSFAGAGRGWRFLSVFRYAVSSFGRQTCCTSFGAGAASKTHGVGEGRTSVFK